MIGYLCGILIYIVLYFGIYYLTLEVGIFSTNYCRLQYGIIRYIHKVSEKEIREEITFYEKLVFYEKKWWQPYKIKPISDKITFDSEETKKIYENIKNSD